MEGREEGEPAPERAPSLAAAAEVVVVVEEDDEEEEQVLSR